MKNLTDWVIVLEIHREGGFRFRIWPNDHGPPHIHAWKGGGHMKVLLTDPIFIVRQRGLAMRDGVRACRIIEANREKFLMTWSKMHG